MSDLVIYDENKQSLSEVAFVKDIPNQVKLRDVEDSYALAKQAGLTFAIVSNHLGIKDEIPQINKQDIMELLLSRFRNLSMDEVAYAFKLERYGVLGDRTQHFQLFNAEFVSSVLEKYVEWKRQVKVTHEIVPVIEEVVVSEEEKRYWINLGVTNAYNFFKEKNLLETQHLFVYKILYDADYLPKDVKYKNDIVNSAIECLEIEYRLLNTDRLISKKELGLRIARIQNRKDPLVIQKCHELVLCKFFRDLSKNQKELDQFLKTFKPEGDYA